MNINIIRFLAFSSVYFSKEEWTPAGTPVFCGGDPAPASTSESTSEMLKAYTEQLPALMRVTNEQLTPTAQAQLAAAQATSPGYNELQQQLYSTYAPQLAATQSQIDSQVAAAQRASELAQVTGTGTELVKAADALQRQIDPEYYATRAAVSDALAKQLIGGLTGGESEAIQRGINQNNVRSGITAPSGETAVAAGMQYGNAANNKLTQALATATGALPTMRSNIDALTTATGRSSGNAGTQQYQGINQNTGNQSAAYNTGNNLLNATTQLRLQENQLESQRKSGIEKANDAMTGVLNSCCFIFLEAYNGTLPPCVRFWRDIFAPQDSDRRAGYIRMANWLVPAMKKSRLIRWLVNTIMIKPMTAFGQWRIGEKGFVYNPINHMINSIWFSIWKSYGKKGVK